MPPIDCGVGPETPVGWFLGADPGARWRVPVLPATIRGCRIGRSIGPKRACARESLGKGESDVRSIEETFPRNPVGQRAHPVESGQQPEASLASWWGDPPAEA